MKSWMWIPSHKSDSQFLSAIAQFCQKLLAQLGVGKDSSSLVASAPQLRCYFDGANLDDEPKPILATGILFGHTL